MKQLLITLTILTLFSCGGGTSAPPFEYQENSRFIIEGITLDENGAVLPNQKIDLLSSNSGSPFTLKTVFSNTSGKFLISVPKGNYRYSINFIGKKIVSVQRFPELIIIYSNQNTGLLGDFGTNYYDLGTVKLINN